MSQALSTGKMLPIEDKRRPLEIEDSRSVGSFKPTKYQRGQQGQPIYALPAPKKTEVPDEQGLRRLLQIEDAMEEAEELLSTKSGSSRRTPLAIEDGRPASVAEKEPVQSANIGGEEIPVEIPAVSTAKKIGAAPTRKPKEKQARTDL